MTPVDTQLPTGIATDFRLPTKTEIGTKTKIATNAKIATKTEIAAVAGGSSGGELS